MSFNYREYLKPEWDKHWSKLHSLRGGARAKTMTKSRKGKDLPYNMSKNYLKYLYMKQRGRCAISNTPLRMEYLFIPYHPLAPSKDRIDNSPEIGYTAGNVQLVVRLLNLAKVQTPDEVFNQCFYEVASNAMKSNKKSNMECRKVYPQDSEVGELNRENFVDPIW